ncbi:hypothetical protein [Catellatospora chokoriensis]|uniref:Uncharacterized protein n=1 Tax=Catellatospora chokoriensis TaxID=310353 RepID=A0A8J3NVL4_9ACTN|nr:hypothetical protein [Catellatospora chokoriensis]GIF94031.1 hypothetical protein Cch02nite_74750 [Catellatospora chokoriensis]
MTVPAISDRDVTVVGEIWAAEAASLPTVLLYDGTHRRGVLVGANPLGQIRLHADGAEHLLEPDTRAGAVTDPSAREALLAMALKGVVHAARQAEQTAGSVRQKSQEVHQASKELRRTVRTQTVRWLGDGVLTEQQVNEYFRLLGMAVYRPTVEVAVTITGTFDIATDDPEDGPRVADDIDVGLSRVSRLVAGSPRWNVRITESTRVDEDAPQQGP